MHNVNFNSFNVNERVFNSLSYIIKNVCNAKNAAELIKSAIIIKHKVIKKIMKWCKKKEILKKDEVNEIKDINR